jgi:CO/xanthine dehydrogenase Mo-binding subunit
MGSGIPFVDMGAAFIKMNGDGLFNLLIGGTDLGTGADTAVPQIAAEVLGVTVGDIVVYAARRVRRLGRGGRDGHRYGPGHRHQDRDGG